MRELRFRAWDKSVEHLYEVQTLIDGGDAIGRYVLNGEMNYIHLCADEIIVEQYTGLKDKNGKEIYEGDVVEYDWYIIGDKPAYRTKEVVVFDDMGARIGNDRIRNCTNVEIIGNIHENPELLKEEG